MGKIAIINVNIDNAYSIVKDCVYSCATEPIKLDDIRFHHNLNIEAIPNALKYGLLSNEMKAKIIEKRELTKEEIFRYSDPHYVNGKDNISLASTEEDLSMMFDHESLYDTYDTKLSSIIVSKNTKLGRNTANYYNEFLAEDIIPVELFNSIEIRMFKLFEQTRSIFGENKANTKEERIKYALKSYEILREIALILKENNLAIPLRESSNVMCNEESNNAITLDIEKVIEMPKLILK